MQMLITFLVLFKVLLYNIWYTICHILFWCVHCNAAKKTNVFKDSRETKFEEFDRKPKKTLPNEQECVKRAQKKYTGSTENNVQEGKVTAGCLVKFSVRLLSVLGFVHLSEKYIVFFYHKLSLQAWNTKPEWWITDPKSSGLSISRVFCVPV